MDFGFTDDQEALRALTVKVLDDFCPIGRPPAPADHDLWGALCRAGLVGAGFDPPEGAGQGLTGLCIVAEELGRRAAATPLWGNGVAGLIFPHLAGRLADGSLVASLALEEAANYDCRHPAATTARRATGGGWRVAGRKVAVPYAATAGFHLVSAVTDDDQRVLALVDSGREGVDVKAEEGTDGEPCGTVVLDDVEADAVVGADDLDRALDLATAVVCASAAGVIDGGLRITADYIAGREQFGRPIAAFQGPAMRIADAYIDNQAVWTSAWSAIRRLQSGGPAKEAIAIAKFWAADGGQRAVHAYQHLHGGMGVDTSYPIHRYFYMAKALEVRLGGATAQLDRLGTEIAEASGAHEAALSDDQRRLQQELRVYFAQLMAEEGVGNTEAAVGTATYRQLVKRLGVDGWLGIGWPVEFGGQGRGPLEQLIFFEEANRADVPLPLVTLNTVGPTLAQFGTDEQKQKFLPGILAGEIHFAIGYTEPGAGTDLASLVTRAERDGDEYVVNGQKVFTTGGHDADFVWLACRTDPDAPKHKGISILIVDTKDPGYSWTPIHTVGGGSHTNATFYDGVRVPASMLVGQENAGWRLITTQLNFERVALGPAGKIWKAYEPVLEWARSTTTPTGERVIDLQWVRHHLARVRARVEVAELWNWRVAAAQESGLPSPADASAMKVYGTELVIEALRLLMEVLGPQAAVAGGDAAVLAGALDRQYKQALVGTFGGGVNEVQREIVAAAGLGLPRVPR